jgi:hypothetical protein
VTVGSGGVMRVDVGDFRRDRKARAAWSRFARSSESWPTGRRIHEERGAALVRYVPIDV